MLRCAKQVQAAHGYAPIRGMPAHDRNSRAFLREAAGVPAFPMNRKEIPAAPTAFNIPGMDFA
ncbi:hypothetical protein LMG26686_00437 [Achromobacter mucicolens]|jgi:hypothetical protein|nr:hypothetical protein LMG26686_00437 [Achromobacter mucicolens]